MRFASIPAALWKICNEIYAFRFSINSINQIWHLIYRISLLFTTLLRIWINVYEFSRNKDIALWTQKLRVIEEARMRLETLDLKEVSTWEHINFHVKIYINKETMSVALVRERTIRTEQRPLVGGVSANFYGQRVSRGQRNGSLRPHSRLSRLESLLFLSSSSSIVFNKLSEPRSRPTASQKIS
jgi:hypothetical protein